MLFWAAVKFLVIVFLSLIVLSIAVGITVAIYVVFSMRKSDKEFKKHMDESYKANKAMQEDFEKHHWDD